MADPIEEILRRAAQFRRQQVQNDDEIIDAEVIEDVVEDAEGIHPDRGVAEHVERRLGSAGFEERLSRLGGAVHSSDDRMEAHLHDVFEHKLGELGAFTSRASDSTLDDDSQSDSVQTESDLRKWFRSPDSLRQAILLNEILQRPEHRW